jgi:tRNA(fMet)-specific endonuclease VapC
VVLDTDVVVDVLRGRRDVTHRLEALSPDDVAITAMTLAELLFGAAVSREPERNRDEVARLVREIRVLPFDQHAAHTHAELRRTLRAKPIGPHDLIIAATTLAVGASLVTANTREYARVPGLMVESWRR